MPVVMPFAPLPISQEDIVYEYGPDSVRRPGVPVAVRGAIVLDNLAAALAEAGYDMRLVLGDGDHAPNHGEVLLPDALRWLWRPMR